MRKIIKINKSLEKSNRNHLVLVDVQVQGRTGAYQSKRWKNPNSAFNYVERDLRRRGIDLNTAQFIDKKTKKQATQQEILKEYHKTGSNNTLQEFIGNKYTIKINKNEGNKDGYRLKDESVIDNNVADKSSLNTEVKNEPFKMGSTNFHIDDLTDIKRASIEYFMRKEEETAEKNKEEFNDLVNKMKSNNDPDLWEKYIFENTKSHRPIAAMFDGNYPFERKAVEYHDESLLRYLQGRGIKNPEIISLREPKRPATDKEIKKWYSYYDGKKSLDQLLTEDFYVRDNKNNINYYGFRKDRARIRLSDDIEYGSFYDTSSTLGKLKNKYEEVLAESPISEFSSSAEKTKYELPIRRKIVEAIEQARQENIMISGEDLLVRAEEILKGKITEKKVKSMVYINQSTPSGVIKVMEEGDTFKVQTPFNEEFVRGLRELEGRRWDSENKVWNIPNKHKDELFMLLENNYNVKPKEEPESNLDNYTLEPKQIYNDNNIELTLVKDELEIKTPYNRTFTNYIRNKGGIWSADKKAWRINNTLKDEVIEDIKKIYNAPMGGETVKVEVDLFGLENDWNVHDSDEYSIKLGDFEVATRSDRDSEVKTGMGVTIYDKDSFPPRGGSRQNPTVSVREGVKATIELNKEIFDNLTDGELKYVKALEEPIYKGSIISSVIIENMDSLLKPLLYGSGPRGGAQKRMAEARAFDAYDKVTENIEKKSDTDKKRELELKMRDFYNALSNGAITISQAMNNPNFKECAYLFILALLEDDEAEEEMNSLIDNLTFGGLLKSRNRSHLVPIETTIHRKDGTHRGIRWTNPRKGMEDLRNKVSNQLKQPLQGGDEITFKRGDHSFNEEEFKNFFLENREEFGRNTTIDEVARGFEIHISRAKKRQLSMFGETKNESIKARKEDTPEKDWVKPKITRRRYW